MVTDEGLRALLKSGYVMEVTCTERAEKKHNTWFARWVVRAVERDGGDRRRLVVSRGTQIRAREFKTVVGLISYIHARELVSSTGSPWPWV